MDSECRIFKSPQQSIWILDQTSKELMVEPLDSWKSSGASGRTSMALASDIQALMDLDKRLSFPCSPIAFCTTAASFVQDPICVCWGLAPLGWR